MIVNVQFELSRNNEEWDFRVKLATYEGGIRSRKIMNNKYKYKEGNYEAV